GLTGGEMRIDGGDVEAGPQGGPHHLTIARVVLHHDGEVVAGTEAALAQQSGQADGACIELPVRHDSAVAHDDGVTVRIRGGDRSGIHDRVRAPFGRSVPRLEGSAPRSVVYQPYNDITFRFPQRARFECRTPARPTKGDACSISCYRAVWWRTAAARRRRA